MSLGSAGCALQPAFGGTPLTGVPSGFGMTRPAPRPERERHVGVHPATQRSGAKRAKQWSFRTETSVNDAGTVSLGTAGSVRCLPIGDRSGIAPMRR